MEESAQILGAGRWRTAAVITAPLVAPAVLSGALIAFVNTIVFVPAIQELSASILLLSSESITLAVAVYNLYETGYLEPVAALSIVTMLIIGLAIWLATRLGRGGAGLERPTLAH